MWKRITNGWIALVEWFEYGDLVPLIVIVSAVHYAVILRGYDHIVVAIAIGLMVDLTHFRSVRSAVRYTNWKRAQFYVRWGIALLLTSVAVAYQLRFYVDPWLAVPLALLIPAMAWLYENDKNVGKTRTKPAPRVTVSKPKRKPKEIEAPQAGSWLCEYCGRDDFKNQQSYAVHIGRYCPQNKALTSDNGRVRAREKVQK